MDSIAIAPVISVDPLTLGVTEWAHLMFGFLWRGIVYTIACMIAGGLVGGIAGGILGLVMAAGGSDMAGIQRITGWVGGALGFAVSVFGLKFYILSLLRARFGTLRISLVRAGGV